MQQINIGVERLEATLAEFIILLLFLIYRKCNYNKKLVVNFIFSQFDTKQQNCEIKYWYFRKIKNFE